MGCCVHIVHELGLEAIFISEVASCEGVVIQHICNEAPVVAKDRDIPPHECDFAVVENHLHLCSLPPICMMLLLSSIILVDQLLQLLHRLRRVLEDILELLAAVTSQMVSLATQLSVAAPELLLLLSDSLFLPVDDLLIFVLTKSFLADEFVIDSCNLIHMLVHAI